MPSFEACRVCDEVVFSTGNVHTECNKLLVAGMSIEEARLERAKAVLYAEAMMPVLKKAANSTAVLTVGYFFITCLFIGILYGLFLATR